MNKNVGIYKITNLVNGKVYIGQSSNLKLRFADHKSKLKNGNHYNNKLRNSSQKYGFENFKFEVIEYTELSALTERENYWIEYYESYKRGIGYNLTKPNENKDSYLMSDDSRRKMSESTTEYTEEFLLSELIRFYNENGRVPEIKDMLKRKGYPTSTTYHYRFGNFKNALELCGLIDKVKNKKKYAERKYSKQLILDKIEKFISLNFRFPTTQDFRDISNDLPSTTSIVKFFGGMNELKKIFGYDEESLKRLERLESLDSLLRLYELEGCLSAKIIDKSRITRSSSYYTRNFGGFINACKLIGIPVDIK